MEQIRRYEIDGIELKVPVYRDDFSGMYLEDYSQWFDLDRFTPSGHLILCSSEDACEFVEGLDSDHCIECAVCRFFKRAGENTLIGICLHEKRRSPLYSINEKGGESDS